MFLNGASVGFDTVNNKAVFIDQTLLPTEYKEIFTDDYNEIFDAIKFLKVRGAPAIGVFTAVSLAVLMNKSTAVTYEEMLAELKDYCEKLILCRPTAVNLKWATEEMLKVAKKSNKEKYNQSNLINIGEWLYRNQEKFTKEQKQKLRDIGYVLKEDKEKPLEFDDCYNLLIKLKENIANAISQYI